jgi:hypothetical protein
MEIWILWNVMDICNFIKYLYILIFIDYDSSDSSSLDFKWIVTPYLQYQIIIQVIIFIIVMGMVMLEKNMWKSVIGLGVIGLGCNLWVIYLSIVNN